MQKLNRLTLNQETLKNLTADDHRNEMARRFSQMPICNTKAVSCPECNPPRGA